MTIIHRLTALGYQHRGDLGVAGREAFFAPPQTPPHHLYACAAGALPLRNHLAIRDQLRSNPELAGEYGELKRSLAREFSSDIDAYIDGKTAFLLRMLANSKAFTADELEVIRGVNTK